MTDHDEIATLHQEATQQRARIKRLEAALRHIADCTMGPQTHLRWIASEALQESSE